MGRPGGGGLSQGKADSLQHRTGMEDSISIRFRTIHSSRFSFFDSTVKDFTLRFPVPWQDVHLGNLGNATESRWFNPRYVSGWDHGMHGFDRYQLTVDDTRFYNTTRPYSELGYMLGSQSEQMIHLLHTQNIKPNWNAAFQYRLINAPGIFQNQQTNHNNYRFSSWYQSPNKRYQQFLVVIGNKLQSGENGGIRQDGNYLDSGAFNNNRFGIPTLLGGSSLSNRNFFSSSIGTGNLYTTATYLLRQQYDLGQKDSIVVNDTTVIPLFYPRLRFEHEINYQTFHFRFKDSFLDSAYYKSLYALSVPASTETILRKDLWKSLVNTFSVYTFPDAKNSLQYLKAGISYQQLIGTFDTGVVTKTFNNLWVHGEYRNRTRNKKWNLAASGGFYVSGPYAGDYDARVSLQRFLKDASASLEIGMENVNRTPSFVFDPASHFFLDQPVNLNKENHTKVYGTWIKKGWAVTAQYQLLSNLTYLKEYYKVRQISQVFTVLQVSAFKEFKLTRKGLHWRSWLMFQQKTGSPDLNLPLLSTRNQISYDGSIGYRNLLISSGLEFRYFTPYKANAYSPIHGLFFYQSANRVSLRAPEITAYAHLRIRSFVAYVRAENLNSLNFSTGNFTRNNLLVPGYPSPGLQIRIGIFWSFVN